MVELSLADPDFVRILVAVAIGAGAAVLVLVFNTLVRLLERSMKVSKGRLRSSRRFFQLLISVTAILLLLYNFEIDVTALLAGLGIGALVIGFAVRDIIENWVSGLLVIGGQVFRIGDVIRVDALQGVVTDVSLRTTTLRSYDQNEIIIPNATLIKSNIVNLTAGRSETVASYTFTIDYVQSPEDAERIIESVLRSSKNVVVDAARGREIRFVVRMRDWTTEIEALFWVNDPANEEFIKSRIAEQVRRRFREAGIFPPIPGPLRPEFVASPSREGAASRPENAPRDD